MSSSSTPASNETTLYGDFPTYLVSQRASSAQATSAISVAISSGYNSAQVQALASALQEVGNTLIALGYWKGSA